MSPALDGRYKDWLERKGDAQGVMLLEFEPSDKVPCLAGCGDLVGVGQKCVECATAAVVAWREQRKPGDGNETAGGRDIEPAGAGRARAARSARASEGGKGRR